MRWLERLRQGGAGRSRAGRAAAWASASGRVLTPAAIPEFCIPPRLRGRAGGGAGGGAGGAAGVVVRTDWDPRSQAALSLRHLARGPTAYGFCALLESPHTRRKESLFLGPPRALSLFTAPAPAPRPLPIEA